MDKPFRPDNPAFIFIKTGTIRLRKHFRNLELSANMFMVTDPQTVYEMISASDDFQSKMVSYKREFISPVKLCSYRKTGLYVFGLRHITALNQNS